MLRTHEENKQKLMFHVRSLLEKIKLNPYDGNALYELSIHCKNGHGGLIKNATEYELFLQRAARCGHQAAIDTISRRIALDKALQDVKMMDKKYKSNAENMFRNKDGLFVAIEKRILPSVVSISTTEGVGTGFFQHPMWLISNAHVLPTYQSLSTSTLSNLQIEKAPIPLERSFHRPNEASKSPDIVIAQVKFRPDPCSTGMPIGFSESEYHTSSLFFYVHYDLNKKMHIIKYLIPCSHDPYGLYSYVSTTFPLYFRCEDGSAPNPGCSGSPVIEARVIVGHNVQWDFRNVGMVFARCPHPSDLSKPKLVCVIPVAIDFEQIRTKILVAEEMSERYRLMSVAHNSLYQTEQSKIANINSEFNKALAKKNLYAFNTGVTSLNISLPPGLEKLIGKGIIQLERSLLLDDNQADYPKERRFENKVDDMEDLKNALQVFLTDIENEIEPLTLTVTNGFRNSKFFRIDVLGGSGTDWKLDLQDNTGVFKLYLTDRHRKLLYSNNQKAMPPNNSEPASSVFAIVKVKANIKTISGELLVNYLKKSVNSFSTVEYGEPTLEIKKERQLSEKEKKSQNYLKSLKLESYDEQYKDDTCTSTTTISTVNHSDIENALPDTLARVQDQLTSLKQPTREISSKTDGSKEQDLLPKKLLEFSSNPKDVTAKRETKTKKTKQPTNQS